MDPRCLLITGHPGTGKSRLLAQLVMLAQARGIKATFRDAEQLLPGLANRSGRPETPVAVAVAAELRTGHELVVLVAQHPMLLPAGVRRHVGRTLVLRPPMDSKTAGSWTLADGCDLDKRRQRGMFRRGHGGHAGTDEALAELAAMLLEPAFALM